jgi:hypothetical protein
MPLLKPFRDYSEKDVINLYTFSGQTSKEQIINKGTLVKVVGEGWRPDVEPTELLGSYGDFSVNNVQAQRYGTPAKVTFCGTGATDYPIGLTLFDIRELDENGIPLKYNPRKAAELEACISGQTVPIVTHGIFLYSGLTGAITPGAPIYAETNGGISATQKGSGKQVGVALGVTGVDGSCLIRLSL